MQSAALISSVEKCENYGTRMDCVGCVYRREEEVEKHTCVCVCVSGVGEI